MSKSIQELFPGLIIGPDFIDWKTGEFVRGYPNGLTLDGDFSAEQLRALADWMQAPTEIERLEADNAKLRAALEPFARNVDAWSLSQTLDHIERRHLWAARAALNEETKGETGDTVASLRLEIAAIAAALGDEETK